nr:hypothetical protein [Deltaproteobacteria bacterium]
PDNAASLWTERKRWFFKPAAGYGSRGAYRGEKITTSKWADILADSSPWIAQAFVPPPERWFKRGDEHIHLRFDVRAIAYAGEVQLFFARLYQGQTTNLRTPGGGFAAILSVPPGCCSTADVTCP